LRRVTTALAALLALVAPAVAAACPQCAGRSDGGIARALVLGAFVMVPFAIVTAVLRVIRAGERDDTRPARAAAAGARAAGRAGTPSSPRRALPPDPRST
jgi:hypothetical protein